ncbi:hypothetical protein F3Y22_tig00110865pilonHSYRG00013 [Hibiscus syriacus]|uniref:Aldehyde dehydrogenase domain-containing protein n=1 Tax=Hibiscus syriacus TaxID=106335 RepID=A0A6A2ZKJ5_HIBSY|nr:hypothetical protein F3Y22_tig00110865pilonHSYRG00013 [Hibiscus syriacus]
MGVAGFVLCNVAASHLPRMHHPSAVRQTSGAAGLKNSTIFRSKGLIGGQWVSAHDGKTLQVNNPSTGEIIADVPFMGRQETNDAILFCIPSF